MVVEGRKAVAVVDGRRFGQRHPRGWPGGQTGPDTHEAPPHLTRIPRTPKLEFKQRSYVSSKP